MSVGRKLILIYALDLTAVIFVSGILINEKFIAIDFARKEIVGNDYIAVVRGALFAARANGGQGKALGDELRTAERRYGAGMDSGQLVDEFIGRLAGRGAGLPPRAIEAGQALITSIGNQSNLILDPDLDRYYTMSLIVLRFPELFELIDQIRGKTIESPARGDSHRLETEYLILEGWLDAVVKGIDADFAEAGAAGKPPFRSAMAAAYDRLRGAINTYRDRAHRVVIDHARRADAMAELDAAAGTLLTRLEETWASSGDALRRLLDARLDGLFQRMWLHLGTAAGLLLLILSVVYFVARQISRPVRQLAAVAERVRATGDYALRARWDSGDELGRLVGGFNDMLEQLNHSSLIEQEMAARERAVIAQHELLEAIPIPLVVTSIPRHEVLHSNVPAQRWLEGVRCDPWLHGLAAPARARFFQELANRDAVNEFEVLWHEGDCTNWALLSARRLLASVRVGDTDSRFGVGDVVILNDVADAEEIMQIVDQRLIPLIQKPHEIEGVELHASCSIGIAVYPEDGSEIDSLMRNADAAMYQAKFAGRNNAQFFTTEMDSRARDRLNIENDLRHAVERGELRLYYQPRVESRSGRLLGVEALVRWQHLRHGLVSPARFISVAEESGLIVPIGAWVIDEACRQHAAWRDEGVGDFAVSVNLSAVQLRDPDLLATLRNALLIRQINTRKIELELTESLLMENVDSTINLFHALKSLGVLLSIDDFGTGYSSLSYLHRFPIDKLKIDQSFVRDMLDDTSDLAITRAIIGLGHTLGLKVVAEGVERVEEEGMLAAAGCDELQGYLFSRPLPPDEFVRWQEENRRCAPRVT